MYFVQVFDVQHVVCVLPRQIDVRTTSVLAFRIVADAFDELLECIGGITRAVSAFLSDGAENRLLFGGEVRKCMGAYSSPGLVVTR